MASPRTPTTRLLATGIGALLVSLAGCSSDAPGDDEPETSDDITDSWVRDAPTRFQEVDWQVVGVDRQAQLPGEDGDDSDPDEDVLIVDLDVSTSVPDADYSLPGEWVQLVTGSGDAVEPLDVLDRDTDDALGPFIEITDQESAEIRVLFPVSIDTTLSGDDHLQLVQEGRLPAHLTGSGLVDETARVPATFDVDFYDGTFSRDRASVRVLEAHWSRELGLDTDGVLIESPENGTRRPPEDSGWLLVHFEVSCEQVEADTGGCNVSGGQVEVDGARADGSAVNGLVEYDEAGEFWAAYPVPFDAGSATVAITGGGPLDEEDETEFPISDLTPLAELAGAS